MNTITEKLSSIFTDKQILAMKDAWRYGSWGDADVVFANGENSYGLGACTNDIKQGGNFSGRQISGIVGSISRCIKKTKTNMVVCFHDWWGDGTGDMIFFNINAFGCDNSTDFWDMLNEWSKSNN